jgi:prepilin-type N-terminal cleavage/methylation domain-containing protein
LSEGKAFRGSRRLLGGLAVGNSAWQQSKIRRDGLAPALSDGSRAMRNFRKRLAGLTLTELLCVMAIITILASLYLGAILRAFTRVVKFLKGFS